MNDMELYQEVMLAQAHLSKLSNELENRRIKEIQKRKQEVAEHPAL